MAAPQLTEAILIPEIAGNLACALDPVEFSRAAGREPDPWQRDVLRSSHPRILLLACRQSGKSTMEATLAAHCMTYTPGALVLIVSPSERQSSETLRKVREVLDAVGWPVPPDAEGMTHLELHNGARARALPGSEATIRGFSAVSLLLLDEAAEIPPETLEAVKPMLMVSDGRMIAATTPKGKRGWFWLAWSGNGPYWRKKVTAEEVPAPRMTPEKLANEQREHGLVYVQREYFVEFQDAAGAVFSTEDVMKCLKPRKGWDLSQYMSD